MNPALDQSERFTANWDGQWWYGNALEIGCAVRDAVRDLGMDLGIPRFGPKNPNLDWILTNNASYINPEELDLSDELDLPDESASVPRHGVGFCYCDDCTARFYFLD